MSCAQWQSRIEMLVDAELPPTEAQSFSVHAQTCAPCAAAAFAQMQAKRAVQSAGRRYTAPAALRARVVQQMRPAPRRHWFATPAWVGLAAMVAIATVVIFFTMQAQQLRRSTVELADLHVTALASATPVDVTSTDRHTVKPWFQGRIPFTFDLPELKGSPFTLVGGRVTYFHQEPGAHLVFAYQMHRILTFIFRDTPQLALPNAFPGDRESSFNMQSWTQGGLRYIVIGDANPGVIKQLSELLQHTQ